MKNKELWDSIYRPKERRTWTRSTNEISLTKDTLKRQDSIMDDSGERRQYSKTGIFGRIYQTVQPMNKRHLHSTTTIQLHLKAADSTSESSRLYIWKQQTLHLKAADSTFDNSRLPEDMLRLCIRVLFQECSGAASAEVFSSLNNSDSGPSNSLLQIARGSRATLSECVFSSKKCISLKRLLQDKSCKTT